MIPGRVPARTQQTQNGGLVLTGGQADPFPLALPHLQLRWLEHNLKQTETRDSAFIWIDIFIYPGHNLFEVGMFYSKEGPQLSSLGD